MYGLRSLRSAHEFTQEELAKKLHVTQSAVSQWDRGVAFPSGKHLVALACLFNCTVDEILCCRKDGERDA